MMYLLYTTWSINFVCFFFLLSDEKSASDVVQAKDDAGVAPAAAPVVTATGNKVMATPAVRRIATEHNVRTCKIVFTLRPYLRKY